MSKLVYKNFVFLFIVQFSNYVLPFLVIPLLTRALGIEGFGKYAYYIALPNLLMIIIKFGFEFSATRQISIEEDNKERLVRIVSSVYLIRACLLVLMSALLFAIISMFKPDQQMSSLVLGGFLLLLGQALLPIWYFQGLQQMKYVTFYTVTTKIVYVGLLFLLISDVQDYGLAVIIYGLAFAVAGVASSLHVFYQQKFRFTCSMSDIKEQLVQAFPFFTSRVCVTSYTASIVPILGHIGTPTQVAIYAASEKLYMAAQSVMYPLANALFPHVAKHRDIALFKKLFFIAIALFIVGGVIGYFVAPHLIIFLFGADFAAAVDIFYLHMIALVFVLPSILLGYPLLAALGFSKEANNSVIFGALLFFVLASFALYTGVAGAEYFVISVIIVEAVVCLLRGYFAMSKVFLKKDKVEEDK